MKNKRRRVKKGPIIILLFIIAVAVCFVMIKPIKKKDGSKKNDTKVSEKSKETKDNKKSMSLVMVGDVLTHDSVLADAKKDDGTYDFTSMFSDIKPMIKNYDLKYVNQEAIIGGPSFKYSGYPTFNAPDAIGDNLISTGFNIFGLANNHAYDKGETAITYSNKYWSGKDVITAGTYSSFDERDDIKVYEKNGIKYAFLAYTTSLNGYTLSSDKSYLVNVYSDELVKDDINKIKDKVDVVIVAMHWGDEYTNTPTNSEKEIAQYLSELGVDLVIGTHPHVVQPIEYVGETLVIYSLGNFISNQLVIGLNPAIGLMVGVDITVDGDTTKISIKEKELLYSYSDNSTKFKVIPFSKMNDDILPDYKSVEEKYMSIVGDVM